MNAAATWSRRLMRLRGEAMGEEFYGKGIDVQLGPSAGPLGRVPQGGRNWEGFRYDTLHRNREAVALTRQIAPTPT